MTDPLSVPMDKLRQALDRVLTEVERERGDLVPLSADHYWILDARATYEVGRTPKERDLMIGQLSDDIATLDEILRPDEVVSVWHDLQHLIGILHRIATDDLP